MNCRCWMSSQFPQRLSVSYITTVAIPCLVILCNSCMLGLVVFKLWELRRGSGGVESTGGWKTINKEKGSRLWKNSATVLGLSCVLGLPWGLASATYISLPGIYVFTVLNSLQGQYVHDPHIKVYKVCTVHLLEEFTAFHFHLRCIHVPVVHGFDLQVSIWQQLLRQRPFLSENDDDQFQ